MLPYYEIALRKFQEWLDLEEDGMHHQCFVRKWCRWFRNARWGDLNTTGSFIYVVLSPYCKDFYVGETRRTCFVRFMEEMEAARLCRRGGRRPSGGISTIETRYMARMGPAGFLCVPLCLAPAETECRRALEREIMFGMNARLNAEVRAAHDRVTGHRGRRSLARTPRGTPQRDVEPASDVNVWFRQRRGATPPARPRVTPEATAVDLTVQQFQMEGDVRSATLHTLLKTVESTVWPDKPTVRIQPGAHQLTDWRALRKEYGASIVVVDSEPATLLRHAIKRLKADKPVTLQLRHLIAESCERAAAACDACADPDKLATRSWAHYTAMLRDPCLTSDHLWACWFNRTRLETHARGKAEVKLSRLFQHLLGCRPRAHLVVKVPYSDQYTRAGVAQSVRSLVQLSSGPPSFKFYMANAVRVVQTRRKSIGDVLCNTKRWVRDEFRLRTAPRCVCARFPDLPKIDGHVCCRASDVPSLFPRVLQRNAKDVLRPDAVNSKRDVEVALSVARLDLSSCIGGMHRVSDDVISGLANRAMLDGGRGASGVRNAAAPCGDAHLCGGCAGLPAPEPLLSEVRRVRSSLRGLVVGITDKNSGVLNFECPCSRHAKLRKLFDPGSAYYEEVKQPVPVVMRRARAAFSAAGLDDLGLKWKPGGGPGKAYDILKDKNLAKSRPIVAGYDCPWEGLDNAAARALNYIRATTRGLDTFELATPTDLAATVAEINTSLNHRTCFPNPDHLDHNRSLTLLDVKDGYTNLDHGDIRTAVRDLLARSVAQHRHRRYISVPKRGCAEKCAIHFGRTYAPESFVQFSMDSLFAALSFTLDHTYILLGDTLLRQTKGVGMGTASSPAIFNTVCAYYEHRSLSRLSPGLRSRIHGCRYCDDLLLVVDARDRLAARLRAKIKYAPSMSLESSVPADATRATWLKYLEGEVRLNQYGHLLCRPLVHGAIPALTTGSIPNHRLQHFRSYVPRQLKHATVTGAVARFSGYMMPTFRPLQSAVCTLQLLSVLRAEGYPPIFLHQAFCSDSISARLPLEVHKLVLFIINAWRRPSIQ